MSDPLPEGEQVNPPDCNCNFIHASDATCRSRAVSKGAIPEERRVFPAEHSDEPQP